MQEIKQEPYKNGRNKTKAQLEEELDEAQKTINKMKVDISAYIKEQEKMQIQLNSARKEKNEALTTLQQSKAKFKQLEELQQINEKFEAEKEKLREDLRAAEAIVDEQTAAREKEKEAMEKKIKDLESQIDHLTLKVTEQEEHALENKKLQKDINDLNAQLEKIKETEIENKKLEEEISKLQKERAEKDTVHQQKKPTASPLTFILEFNEEKGHIRGLISHPSSQSKKEFIGIDGAAILGFLEDYEPAFKDDHKIQTLSQQAQGKMSYPQLSHVDVYTLNSTNPTKTLKHNEPFHVQLTLDSVDKEKLANINMKYKASIYAKSISGKQHILAAETTDTLKSTEPLCVDISPNTLSPGLYRLEAVISFLTGGKKAWPISAFQEGNLVTVY